MKRKHGRANECIASYVELVDRTVQRCEKPERVRYAAALSYRTLHPLKLIISIPYTKRWGSVSKVVLEC